MKSHLLLILNTIANPSNPYDEIPQMQSTKRMKPIEEKEMMNHFEAYKQKWQCNE